MLEVEIDRTRDWDGQTDWERIAADAVKAAFSVSAHGELADAPFALSISIRLADDAEVHELNRQWRGKDKPTNVLSFPMLERAKLLALPADGPPELLGDLALALETCRREAADKGISLEDHAVHLIIHGLLHLAGYDHELGPAEAREMELLEIKALAQLGIADPYGDHDET